MQPRSEPELPQPDMRYTTQLVPPKTAARTRGNVAFLFLIGDFLRAHDSHRTPRLPRFSAYLSTRTDNVEMTTSPSMFKNTCCSNSEQSSIPKSRHFAVGRGQLFSPGIAFVMTVFVAVTLLFTGPTGPIVNVYNE